MLLPNNNQPIPIYELFYTLNINWNIKAEDHLAMTWSCGGGGPAMPNIFSHIMKEASFDITSQHFRRVFNISLQNHI